MTKLAHISIAIMLILFSISDSRANGCPIGAPGSSDVCVLITDVEQDGTSVTFHGYGGGYNNGNPLDFSHRLNWYSNENGYLGTGKSITVDLDLGAHQISAAWGYPGASYKASKNIFVREKYCAYEQASLAETIDEVYSIDFHNKESVPAKVFWLTYSGERMHYATLQPGERLKQNGYPGNQWLVTDNHEQCIQVMSTGYYNAGYDIHFEH
ncbi:hypothetical protein [Aliikangiella coralliicola]|uniref:Uncharacterized protein n=1 Tax=Aliikangiella coralliicola TaxID=2592383 RepID=A0A545UCJ6_9GAMM|nr:hypothetical protein [Aliikangiella coralliicola]TQV87192.1 hypothetical protein FLL46_15425 [Aliikangiella coralliicola]